VDDRLKDVTVIEYRRALLRTAERVHVVKPEELREPVRLWLRASEEQARSWRSLLGQSVVSPWNAAQAILNASDS